MIEVVSGTRVFGDFKPERYQSQLAPFIENASPYGEVAIITQEAYPYIADLRSFVKSSSGPRMNVHIRYSDTVGAQSPADMCNQIILACADLGHEYFAVVSSDLSGYIPQRYPSMLERLKSESTLSSVGTAIQGVHNFALLNEIEAQGLAAVRPDNYATIFHNNAFAIHKLGPQVGGSQLSLEERLFPRITDQGRLGSVEIDGKAVPIGGNEEIALVLQLLRQGKNLDTMLLAGQYAIVRDPSKELSSVDAKILRRPLVAAAYQRHYGITDSQVLDYLLKHYNVAFS